MLNSKEMSDNVKARSLNDLFNQLSVGDMLKTQRHKDRKVEEAEQRMKIVRSEQDAIMAHKEPEEDMGFAQAFQSLMKKQLYDTD